VEREDSNPDPWRWGLARQGATRLAFAALANAKRWLNVSRGAKQHEERLVTGRDVAAIDIDRRDKKGGQRVQKATAKSPVE
jgi:hypothetical protein